MKSNFTLTIKKLQTFILILGLVVVSFSCKDDDDKVDCSKAETTIEGLFDDYYDAYLAEDCAEMANLRSDVIAAIKKYKSCEYIQDALEASGVTFDEALADLNDSFDEEAASVGCN